MADLLHATSVPELTSTATNLSLNDPQNLTGFSQILEELPAVDATPTVTYTIGSRVLAQEQGGTVSHLMADGHGSTRLVTGANGAITDRYSYDAYGLGVDFTAGNWLLRFEESRAHPDWTEAHKDPIILTIKHDDNFHSQLPGT